MNLSDQVCSLELAKQLWKLKVKQDSLFWWYFAMHDGVNSEYKVLYSTFGLMSDRYSAFTVAELGEMLPCMVNGSTLDIIKYTDIRLYGIFYCTRYFNAGIIGEPDTNEANSRAKMLIWLIENGIVKV